MPRSSLTRTRRLQPPAEPSLRLLTFQLRSQWFCLPLVLARRVISEPADRRGSLSGLTQLQRENIPLIDIAALVYQDVPRLPGEAATEADAAPGPIASQSVLVVEPPSLETMGLLIDGIPAIKRAKQSDFTPVPSVYLIMNRLQGINTLVNLGENEPPHFLLELDGLLTQLLRA
jgi:chemotaxis signal transduction protein